MSFKKWWALVAVAVWVELFLAGWQSPAPGADIKRVLAMLEASLESIRSFDVRLDVTQRWCVEDQWSGKGREATLVRRVKRPSPYVKQYAFRQVFQTGKGRIEYLDLGSGNPNRYTVYDGEVERTLNPAKGTGLIRPPFVRLTGEGMDYLTAWRNVYQRLSVVRCFRERKNVVLAAPGPDSREMILEAGPVIDTADDIAYPSEGFRVALDSGRGLMPSRIERFEDVQGKLCMATRRTVTEWKDLGEGIWVPITVVTEIFDLLPDKGTFGEVYSEVTMKVDLNRSVWNTDIPADTFELQIPAGIRMTDQFRQVQYVTGKADPGKNLADLAANARKQVSIPTGRPPIPPRRPSYWLTVGLPSLVVVGISLALVYLRRRKVRVVR